jgi:fibronectin-binding autotransporter adhesin
MDGVLHQSEAGSLVAGVNAQFGTVSSDITSMYGTGSVNALGFGLGGTLTWYGTGGLYVDGQAQLIRYSADITSDDTGTTLVEGNDAFGYGLSVEAGQKIGLDDNWSLTPQAQLSYSAVRFSDFTDQYDGTVSLSDGGDTLVGRLGLSADYEGEWQDAAGETKRTHLYGIANLYYDFLDGSTVDVSGTKFVSQNQGLWGGVGIGGSLSWADEQYSIFGEALVRGSVDDFGGNNALGAKVGFSGKW